MENPGSTSLVPSEFFSGKSWLRLAQADIVRRTASTTPRIFFNRFFSYSFWVLVLAARSRGTLATVAGADTGAGVARSNTGTKRLRIDIRNKYSLMYSGFDPLKKNVIIIHGFNGTESKSPITTLRNEYVPLKASTRAARAAHRLPPGPWPPWPLG
ncbi:hypothetical protein NQ317_008602 [Molorchus minor]|uniref:Uncharacterized protein n=1 Tax=Molorchus minor TaxID=1323400 RepID=A0ABQ9JBS8_9CUCU|nr:hypothetical protein NQ317_008602 [Molorchus minor]